MDLNIGPLCRVSLSVALHFTPKAYPEGSLRFGSLSCIENPLPLWMK
jgi:hypothetical protein